MTLLKPADKGRCSNTHTQPPVISDNLSEVVYSLTSFRSNSEAASV